MSPEQRRLLHRIARALEYPGQGWEAKQRPSADHVSGTSAEQQLKRALGDLDRYLSVEGKDQAEERYTVLFDLSPVCTLNVGYHLFGDTYARGELLAGLASEMNKAGVLLEGEIPDFLPALLRLLGQLPEAEDRRVLLTAVLLPGLTKMNEALRSSEDAWSRILRALPDLLEEMVFGEAQPVEAGEASTHA